MLTPAMEPMRVWELEQGIPRYHVPTFHIIAVMMRAITSARLWYIFTSVSASTGRRLIMPMATAIPPTLTPMKFHMPDHITAVTGLSECV